MRKIIIVFLIFAGHNVFSQMKQTMSKAGKWGYKDAKTGKTIPEIYDRAGDFIGGAALVEKGKTHFIIDEKGKQLHEFKQWAVYHVGVDKVICVGDSIAGEYTTGGVPVVEMRFDQRLRSPEAGGVLVLRKGNSVGFLHVGQSATLSLGYETSNFQATFMQDGDELYFYKTARFCLKKNGKYGVIDPYMKIILPFDYDLLLPTNIYSNEQGGYLGAAKNGRCGLIDYEGKEKIPFEFDLFLGQYSNRERSSNDPYVFTKGGKVVFYDLATKKMIPKVPPGEDSYSRADCCILSNGEKFGIIDTVGNILVPFEYDYIEFSGGEPFFKDQAWRTCRVQAGKTCALYVPGVGLKTPFVEGRGLERGTAYDKLFYIRTNGDEYALLDEGFKLIMKVDFKSLSFSQGKILIYDSDGRSGSVAADGKITWDQPAQK